MPMVNARVLLLLCAAFAAPAAAQDAPRPFDPSMLEGLPLEEMGRAARQALEALGATAAPWAQGLGSVMADPGAYDPPETLPNGDILIRRRDGAAPPAPDSADPLPGLDL